MLTRITTAVLQRWHDMTAPEEKDRGDSPVPTVIIWVGIALVAITLIGWATTLVNNYLATPVGP
jgi:hypothetical protein